MRSYYSKGTWKIPSRLKVRLYAHDKIYISLVKCNKEYSSNQEYSNQEYNIKINVNIKKYRNKILKSSIYRQDSLKKRRKFNINFFNNYFEFATPEFVSSIFFYFNSLSFFFHIFSYFSSKWEKGIIHLVRTQNFPKKLYFLPPDTQPYVASMYFFDVISMVEISPLFPRTFFVLISLVEKSTLFPRTFFDVISLVEKSRLFPLTFPRILGNG